MKKIFTFLALLITVIASAQQNETATPDYALIEKNVKDMHSPYYYPALFERYQKADTSMTTQERRHLYYGFAFVQKPYDKDKLDAAQSGLKKVLQKQNPGPADMDTVITLTTILLEAKPFSLTLKEYRLYCLKELGRYGQAVAEREQANIIIDAILSSGDGTTKKNSIHVLDAGNEYDVVSVLGFETAGNEFVVNGKYDYLTLNKNLYNLPGLYFEVAASKKLVTGL